MTDRPALQFLGILAAAALLAASCGGGGGSTVATQPDQPEAGSLEPAASPGPDPSPSNFIETRSGAGIAAAGGRPHVVRGADPCANPGSAAGEPLHIALLGANLDELGALGFEMTVVDDPTLIVSAYVNEVNRNGGIGGRCVEFVPHLWSLNDPIGSFIEVCAEVSERNPVFYLSLRLYDPGLQCTTFGAPIPAIGLYTSVPESTIADAAYLLYADDGSVEHLLSRTVEVGLAAGVVQGSDRVGLLHGTGPSAGLSISVAEAVAQNAGIELAVTADIPREFGDLSLLLPERQVGLLQAESERDGAQLDLASLAPDDRTQLEAIEGFFTETATRFEAAGVSTVIATAQWSDVRRMMRAAELIDWAPTWLISDMQPATLTTADAPPRQIENLRQVSARRAAGDVVPELDQGCITLRNTAAGEGPFNHRPHTDAWNVITAICDYLDVSFSALTRIDGPVDHVSFLEALNETHYDAQYGGLITFSDSDRNGAERFRILAADASCVLNYWGCMRSTTDWLSPVHRMDHAEADPGQARETMEEMGHEHGDSVEMDDTGMDHSEMDDTEMDHSEMDMDHTETGGG